MRLGVRGHRLSTAAGFTLAEVLMVALIIMILTAGVVGGYSNMQKNQRLASATEKVQSTLHLARSLAIANNTIYHVRIENWCNVADTTMNDPYADQVISVHCFPSISDAMKITREDAPEISRGWNIAPTIPPNLDPPFNNYCVDRIRLDRGTYLGIQQDTGATAPSRDVLAFYPDGSASAHMTIYVTDVATGLTSDRLSRTPLNDFRDCKDQSADYYRQLNTNRILAVNNGNAQIRMIRVLQGGLIKPLAKERYQP